MNYIRLHNIIIPIFIIILFFYKLVNEQSTSIREHIKAGYKTTTEYVGHQQLMDWPSKEESFDEGTASEAKIIKRPENRTKVILFWTPRLDEADWSMGVGRRRFRQCRYSNCEFTIDKNRLDEADMLLFYCEELPHFPDRRLRHQLYVHMTKEAPPSAKINGYGMYGGHINITASYRKDGNLWLPYFYMEANDQPEDDYRLRTPFNNRTRSIAWLVSNCNTCSKRELYVNELSKYIDVDVYGVCGNKSCDAQRDDKHLYTSCFSMFERTYKFYLAFENNICKDYYTEKLSNAMTAEIVPIVFGGADYEQDFPRGSLINVLDFPNPKDLAHYLMTMTEEEYNGYFQWKAKYHVSRTPKQCTFCEFLHDSAYTRGEQILPPSFGGNYTKWWHDSCNNDLIYELKEKGGW